MSKGFEFETQRRHCVRPPPPPGSAHNGGRRARLLPVYTYFITLIACAFKMMFAYLKHSLLVGVPRCLDCLGLSLHPLKNFELVSSVTPSRLHKSAGSPEPSRITSACSDPMIKKDTRALHRSSPCRTCACVLLI